MEFLFFHIDFPVKLQGTVKDVLKKNESTGHFVLILINSTESLT